jgi:hypothetical protein
MALADSDTLGQYHGVAGITHAASPKAGYWFENLISYEIDPVTTPPRYNAQNPDRFGFGAFPHRYGSSGKLVFLLNEAGAMIKKDPGGAAAYLDSTPNIPSPGQTTDTRMNLHSDYDTFPCNPAGPATPYAAGRWSNMD